MIKEYEEDELIAISELKERTKEILPEDDPYAHDNLFFRFLKARDFNLDDAENMLKQHLEWRKKYDVKNISKWKHPEVFKKYLAFNKLGLDKEGDAVVYIPSGNIDWIGIFESVKFEDSIKFLVNFVEQIIKDMNSCTGKIGKTSNKQVYIHNMENLSFNQATNKKVVSNAIYLLNLYMDNYPEMLKTIYVLNASKYFHLMFSVVQKFLSSAMLRKIKVYSDDSWKKDFLKIMDAEKLPAFLGGKKTDPDGNPLCLTFIKHGKTVPQKYYIHRSKRSLADLPDVQRLTLSRATFGEIILEVNDFDSYLEWEFETKSKDIGFGLFLVNDEGKKVEIIPLQRINTDEYSERGLYKCDSVGKYVVVFDNTYSILTKKEIFYKIKVKKEREKISEFKMPAVQDS